MLDGIISGLPPMIRAAPRSALPRKRIVAPASPPSPASIMKAGIGSAASPSIWSRNAGFSARNPPLVSRRGLSCRLLSVNNCAVAVHVLDTRQLGRPNIIAATALETADGVALFDTGPESTFDNIAAELQRIGAAPRDVRHVFLSHIHFDHAGAAWRFAQLGATIYVHQRGARHLTDPAKLVESATRIFGDEMQKLWGTIAPVPEQNLRVLEDDQIVRLGSLEVRAIETPGHATHHHVYHWEDNLFGGDVAGVRIGGGPPIPPFVPPELDVEAWERSIDKMRALDAPAFTCRTSAWWLIRSLHTWRRCAGASAVTRIGSVTRCVPARTMSNSSPRSPSTKRKIFARAAPVRRK
jgi:glyoxylase-like metal-dependent hydrolase (beta-lactamase superfamily II)